MKKMNQRKTIQCSLLLLLASMIWGFAFISQSVGAEYVGPNTFLAIRSWIAVAFLLPVIAAADRIRERNGQPTGAPANGARRRSLLIGGLLCGTALFCASCAQQVGIAYTTTAKAGFITALYVMLVPVLSIFLGRMPGRRIWVSVLLGLAGLYLLCLAGGLDQINKGDLLELACAFLFSIQIMLVHYFSPRVDGIRLSCYEALTQGVIATVCVALFEHPTREALLSAAPALLYAGLMSSGVAYTLQIIGQKGLDPTVASLIMCLESVFSAIGGWLLLGQRLTGREIAGCGLMFAAIVLSQLPDRKEEEETI